MRITDTSQQLRVMLRALETDLLPELKSSTALATAGLIKMNLEALLKRETGLVAALSAANSKGVEIVAGMKALLGERADIAATEESISFSQASAAYDALLNQMTSLAARLLAICAKEGSADVSALLRQAAEWECGVHAQMSEPLKVEPASEANEQDPLPKSALESFIQSVHPDGSAVSIIEFERIHGGFAKQTFKFSLRNAAGQNSELIARKMDRVPVFSLKAYLIEREFVLLQALHAIGYPVAKPLWVTTTPPSGIDANFFITQKLSGRPPGSFLGGAGQLPERLLLDLAELLARLHGIGLDKFSDYIDRYEDAQLLTETVEACYKRTIADWQRYSREMSHLPSPIVSYLFDWLGRNIPHDARPPVLIHGDFSIHNVLAVDGRISAVLDWEAAMFGAPEQDLAWIRPHIAKHIDWNRFVAHYVASGGREPDAKSLDFYAAFSAMTSMCGLTRSVGTLQSGAVPDIRITMIENGFASHLMQYAMLSTSSVA